MGKMIKKEQKDKRIDLQKRSDRFCFLISIIINEREA